MTVVDPASALRGDTPSANGDGPGHDALPGPDAVEPEQPAGTDPDYRALKPFALGDAMRRKVPPPKVGFNLLYAQTVHSLSGPPESAKTVLALWLALKTMRAGRNVLILDEETGWRQTADLLNSMGAEPELIDARLTYFDEAQLQWHDGDRDRLGQLLNERAPFLVIIDSMAEILSAARVDENDPGEVTRFVKHNIRPISRRFGSSVLLIDHDAKGDKPSRYARGTGAKLSAGQIAFKATPIRPFSRTNEGLVGLTVSKDRYGCLHRYWKVRVVPTPLLDLEFTEGVAPEASESGGSGQGGLSPAAMKLLSVLTEQPSSGMQLVDRVVGRYGPPGMRRETVSRIMGSLAERGAADKLQQGREVLWFKPGATLLDEIPPPDDPSGSYDSGWPAGTYGDEANR